MNRHTWCPQCGPDVDVDEDGCCDVCGADAVGPGADGAWQAKEEAERYLNLLTKNNPDVIKTPAIERCATALEGILDRIDETIGKK